MPSERNKNSEDLITFLKLTNLFHRNKTKETNEEIYHNANFPDPDKLIDPDRDS